MTEAEWLACTDPGPMLDFLRGRATDRKLRLFAVACCRRYWDQIDAARIRRAVEVAEQYADGRASEDDLRRAHSLANQSAHNRQAVGSRRGWGHPLLERELRLFFAAGVAHPHRPFLIGRLKFVGHDPDLKHPAADILRDIFGSLRFHPVGLGPGVLAWNDRLVVRLAQAIYDERRWGDMPLLADALLDAGCDEQEAIEHCRGPGPHSRGCWTLDLLLNKE